MTHDIPRPSTRVADDATPPRSTRSPSARTRRRERRRRTTGRAGAAAAAVAAVAAIAGPLVTSGHRTAPRPDPTGGTAVHEVLPQQPVFFTRKDSCSRSTRRASPTTCTARRGRRRQLPPSPRW